MLGSPVPFGYCRTLTDGQPCRRTIQCWWEIFNVVERLRTMMPDEAIAALTQARPPTPKVNQLLDLIAQAKQRTRKDDAGDY